MLHAKANSRQPTVATASSYEVAFEASSGYLWSIGYAQHGQWPYRLAANTNPIITPLAGGGYEIAFQDDTGHLALLGTPAVSKRRT